MLYCSKCGKKLYDDADFCSYCGAMVKPIFEINEVADSVKTEAPYYRVPVNGGNNYADLPSESVYTSELQTIQVCQDVAAKRKKTGIIISTVSLVLFFALLIFAFYLMISYGENNLVRRTPAVSAPASTSSGRTGNILAFENSGVKIYFSCWKGATKDSSPGVEILVKNNSGKEITVNVSDVELDGHSLNGIMYENVSDGSEKYATVFFKKDDLEAAGITAPSSVQMRFVVLEKNSGEPICSSEILRVKTK